MKNQQYENAKEQLEKINKYLNLDEPILRRLMVVDRLIEVNFPVRMDNGEMKMFTGF